MANLVISGDTSGTVTLAAPAVSGTTTLTLPTTTGTVVADTATQTLTNKTLTSPTISSLSSASATALTLQSAGTTAVTIDTSQNVGIGQTSPLSKLDIIVNTANGDGIKVTNNNNSAYFTLNANGATGYGVTGWANSTVLESVPASTGGLVLGSYTGNITFQTARTERMRIDSSGTPMFNCTSQLIRAGETFRASMGSGLAAFYANTGGPTIAVKNAFGVNTYQIAFSNSAGEVGTISTGSGSTAYNTSSDYRLKDNVEPMVGALNTVAQLKPVNWKWKSDGSDGQGFIAHELQSIVPTCVTGEKDAVDAEGNPVYQGVDTSFLVATLTAAIQEQQAIIETLKADIEDLKAKVK